MRRRDLLTALGIAAVVARSFPAYAQAPKAPVIGFLHQASAEGSADFTAAFLDGLRESGYVDGQNVAIEYRWANGQYDRLPTLAADLVVRKVDVIVAGLFPSALAAKAATKSIPIVFVVGSDPVKSGLVASVSRPDANITGASIFSTTLVAKRLELLHELVPAGDLIGVLVNSRNPNAEANLKDVNAAARAIGQRIVVAQVTRDLEFESAFAALAAQHVSAVFIMPDTTFIDGRSRIASLGLQNKIPVISGTHEVTAAGALASYGASQIDVYRQAATYAGRILKGARPGELPIMQPAKFELVINLKTAKALDLGVPPTLLARADEVIE